MFRLSVNFINQRDLKLNIQYIMLLHCCLVAKYKFWITSVDIWLGCQLRYGETNQGFVSQKHCELVDRRNHWWQWFYDVLRLNAFGEQPMQSVA